MTAFADVESEVFAPTERLSVSEFSDRYRVLPQSASKPGPWRTSFAEFWREPLDSFGDPDLEQIVISSPAQVGKSSLQEGMIAYLACVEPSDSIYIVPRIQDKAPVAFGRFQPMLSSSPELAAQCLDLSRVKSVTADAIRFLGCTLYIESSGSAAGLAAKTCRNVFLDEIGKWKPVLRREGSPIELARARSASYEGNRKIVLASSPTTRKHGIWPELLQSDHRTWHVPCRGCGAWFVYAWEQVRYVDDILEAPRTARPSELAWHECPQCGLKSDDAQRREMTGKGIWVPSGGTIVGDGGAAHACGGSQHPTRGYQVHGLMSPFRSCKALAIDWKKAQGSSRKLGAFIRSQLGEPWEDTVESLAFLPPEDGDDADDRAIPKGVAPELERSGGKPGRLALFSGADIGKRAVHWCTIAVARGPEVWVIDYGMVSDIHQLDEILARNYGTDSHPLSIYRMLVDSGYRPDRVYSYTGSTPRAAACKGRKSIASGRPFLSGQARKGVRLITVDTTYMKDWIVTLQDTGKLHLPVDVDPVFVEQLGNESKVIDENGLESWEPRFENAPTHFLDTLVYALAAIHSETRDLWKPASRAEEARMRRRRRQDERPTLDAMPEQRRRRARAGAPPSRQTEHTATRRRTGNPWRMA